jgi:AcrR family transcriptional regulator
MSEPSTRQYRSSVREQQARATRQRILEAAGDLFGARGWAGTGMRDVADSAGVSVETVYKNFSSKGELLHRVIDVIVVGDDEPVPLAQRDAYLAMGTGDVAERAKVAAALVASINARQAPLVPAMREAASSDSTLAALVAQLHDQRRLEFSRGGSLVAGRQLSHAEADGLWALLSVDVYLLLTRHVGWTDAAYQAWASDSIVALLDTSHRSAAVRPRQS